MTQSVSTLPSKRAALQLLALSALSAAAGVSSTAAAQTTGSPKGAKARGSDFWRRWLLLWNGDLESVAATVASNFRLHASMLDGSDPGAINGPAKFAEWLRQLRQIFPDLTFSTVVGPLVDDRGAQGLYVTGHWQATGKYAGGMPGATVPVGTEVRFNGTDIVRVGQGKAMEYWLVSDTIALMRQLGVGR